MLKNIFKNKLIIALIFLLALGLLSVSALAINQKLREKEISRYTTGKDRYIRKEIIFSPWGSGKSEFGLGNIYALGDFKFASGPAGIWLDHKGNIYIWDGVNERIQKYSKNGQYLMEISYSDFSFNSNTLGIDDLRIDKDNSIYFLLYSLDMGSAIKDYFVRLYSASRGVKDFPVYIRQEILDLPEKRLYVDNGNVFIGPLVSSWGWQVLNNSKVVAPALQKIRKQIPFQKERYGLPGEIESERKGSPFAFDIYGNIYLLLDTSAIKALGPQDWEQKIYKYDKEGNFLTEVKIELDHLWYRRNNINIDEYGNIYQLLSKPEGTYVMKWEAFKK